MTASGTTVYRTRRLCKPDPGLTAAQLREKAATLEKYARECYEMAEMKDAGLKDAELRENDGDTP